MRLIGKTFLTALLLACSVWLSIGASGQEVVNSSAGKTAVEESSRAAPNFALPDLRGKQVGSADLKDNVIILDFWATWCEPCISEIPIFNTIQQEYASRGVKVIGVAVQSGWPRDVRRFVTKHKMRYTILVGNDDIVSGFEVIAFPTTYIIAPGWKIHKKYSGAYEKKSAELERDIEALLQSIDEKKGVR
ncbi:MAG: TlpA disulfide reductase family protein [Acidobacteriota bacterium]